MAGQLNLETYVGDVLSAPLQFATDRTGATPIDLTGKTYQALVLTSSGSTAATMTTPSRVMQVTTPSPVVLWPTT
jgi:hypothetical protein